MSGPHTADDTVGIAMVTGAGGGIGGAIAERLHADRWRVIATDLEAPTGLSPGVIGARLDVRDAEAVEPLVADLWREYGPIGALVNTAGVLAAGSVADTDVATWDRLFEVNARGVFLVSRAVGTRMARHGSGSIVTVGSNAGSVPRAGMAGYAASKAAASSITRSLGLELGPAGVRCNVVAPGSTRTPMLEGLGTTEQLIAGVPESFKTGIPLRRIADPADIAAAVAFLSSAEARHITVQELVVDGGACQR